MIKKQIESKVLTVSEIAEKVDVTRNVVWSYIRRNKIKPVVKEKKNFKFDSEIVLKIKKEQKKKQFKDDKNRGVDSVSKDVLEILHEQLKVKDEQIKEQAEIINFLRSEVVQARLESKKQQKLLEDFKNKEKAVSADELKKDNEKKRHWWQKLFQKCVGNGVKMDCVSL